MADKQYDFSGWATKNGIVCTDGRTIQANAFKHNDGQKVPLVWQHLHNSPENILGHAVLENRPEGVYVYGWLNDSPAAKMAKTLLAHKDIEALSIYANQLVEKNKMVHGGNICEVSMVIAGANPGALIENVTLSHSDGSIDTSEEEAVIYTGLKLELNAAPVTETKVTPVVEHAAAAASDETVQDVFDTLSEKQKQVVYALIANALDSGNSVQQSTSQGENFMKSNVFDGAQTNGGPTLSHAQLEEFATNVFTDFQKTGNFHEAFMAHAGTYGIDNISYLFPDAHLDADPTFYTRRMGWVADWMNSTRHTPFSRLKKVWADLTPEAARAKGYITGNQKVEQVFALLKRTTEPTTIYKKQKLDKDDISDITDFDVVNWMWTELRFMLQEEVARAGLVGDGRVFGTDNDAIDPSKIRPIYGDVAPFVYYLTLAATVTDYFDIIEQIQLARVNYRGKGMPNLYVPNAVLMGMLLLKDTTNRRIYKSVAELAADLRVADVIEVEVMEGLQRDNVTPAFTADLLGIMVNPSDYTYGTDKGGQIATFDQFDIDFNQQKYLIETRLSGSLLDPKTAIVIERKTA